MSGYPGYPPQQGGYPPQGYPPAQGGYPPQQGGYPPQTYPPAQGGYPPQSYPPAQGGYPPQGYPPAQGGYPPAQGGYPPQQGGYPPQGYPPAQGGYPPAQGGYPPAQGGYPPAQGGYPPAQGGYPPAQGGYPPAQGGYPPAQGGYPPAGAPGAYPQQPGVLVAPHGGAPTGAPLGGGIRCDPARDADDLRKAMKGLGTDEEALINILGHRNFAELEAIRAEYLKRHGKDLGAAIKSETSGKLERVLVGLLKEPRQFDADVLHEAMKGLGTDEKTLMNFMIGRNFHQMAKIRDIYSRNHGKSLEHAIAGELSGDLKKFVMGLATNRDTDSTPVNQDSARADAERLYGAGEGKLGTDEATFIEIFTRRSHPHLRATFVIYETIHKHHTMDRAVESEFSGDLKTGLLGVVMYVRNPAEFWADVLFRTMKGAGTDDAGLIRAIVGNRENLTEIKQAFSNKYHKSLYQAVNSETSGDYKKALLAIIGN